MIAMKRDDIDIFARLHRLNPHATTAFDVAVAMLLFRSQLPGDSEVPKVRPKDIQDRLGITYDNARKALKRASDALDSLGMASMQPDDNHPDDNRPVGRSSTGRSSTGKPDDNRPVPPHPPYKDQEGEREREIGGKISGPRTNGNRLTAGLREAIATLGENLQTDPLATYLARNSHLPEVRALAECDGDGKYPAGWRIASAALKFLSPRVPDNVRSCRDCRASLNYMLSIARGLDAPYTPPSLSPTAPGAAASAGGRGASRRRPDFASMPGIEEAD